MKIAEPIWEEVAVVKGLRWMNIIIDERKDLIVQGEIG